MQPNGQQTSEQTAGSLTATTNADTGSAHANTAESQTANSNTQANSGESPTPNQAEAGKPKSMLEAVKAALGERDKAGDDKAGDAGAQSPGANGDADGKTPGAADEGTDAKSADTKRGKGYDARISQLVAERDGFKGKAEQWDQFSSWARSSGLDATELANSLALARMVKENPHEALSALRGIVTSLEQQTGHVLPDDLKQKVAAGLIDDEAAIELSVARSRAAAAENRRRADAEAREQEEASEREAAERVQFARSIGEAVSNVERQLESTDPDYPKIKGLVQTKIQALIATGQLPKTADEAVAQVKQAVADVKRELAGILPQRGEVRHVTGNGNHAATAKPRSALEAARMAMNGQAASY